MGIDMATTDAPFGFTPWGPVLHASMYAIAASYGTAVCPGDIMEIAGTAASTPDYGTLPTAQVEETGAAGTIIGACLATFDYMGDPCYYIAASTAGNGTIAGYALIADHPDQLYVAQEDGDTSSIVVANIGLNAEAISTATESSANNYHGCMEIDSDSVTSDATLALQVLRPHPDDTISAAGAAGNHCRFIVKIASSYAGSQKTGA